MNHNHEHSEEVEALFPESGQSRTQLPLTAPPVPAQAEHAIGQSATDAGFFNGELSWLDYGERLLELADELAERLRRAGIGGGDPTRPGGRAPGLGAFQPHEVVVPQLTSGATAGDVLRRAIAASVVRLARQDPVMRLDTDPEGVHQARVATRRLRSDLRTFRPLLDREWASALRAELDWLAGELGVVRDGDVMLERMRTHAAQLPQVDARGATPMVTTLESARGEAHSRLLETLRGGRYLALLDRLVDAANAPALLLEADLPAPAVLPALVRRPWRRLAGRVKALAEPPLDEELHAVRIEAKRVRYAAEAAAPLLGRQARSFARAAAALQEVLGDLNDAVMAERWLRSWADEGRSTLAAFTAGELATVERAAAQEARARWHKAWKDLASPKLRAWM